MATHIVNWKYIDQKYPSTLKKDELSEGEYRKQRTIELYSFLPQTTLEERDQYRDIRDAVIELNYTFFGYIASHKFVNNQYISYEDKFQSAILHFCEMWTKFKYAPKYRCDLAFTVFFKPRITECMERDFDEVKYSLRRSLCMEVSKQLDKHWAQVTYEDLSDPRVKLTPDKMSSLQAAFGSMYVADIDTHLLFVGSDRTPEISLDDLYSDDYESLTDLLIHEMVEKEKDLTDKDLIELSDLTCIPFEKLKETLPEAKSKLHKTLTDRLQFRELFATK